MNVHNAILELEKHIIKHSNNKYQSSILDSERPLEQPIFTLLSAHNYIVRYLAQEGEKTGNIEDLLKACHFILFEIQNRINNE